MNSAAFLACSILRLESASNRDLTVDNGIPVFLEISESLRPSFLKDSTL